MTLPSNVASPSYHDNKISYYITQLPKQLELRDYEVALSEICYPHSFDNVYKPINKVVFHLQVGLDQHLKKVKYIPPGYYKDMHNVADTINIIKPQYFKGGVDFEKSGRERAKIVLFEKEGLDMHPTLAKLLGFDEHRWRASEIINIEQLARPHITGQSSDDPSDKRQRFKAVRQGNMNSLLYNIFIYSSICKDSLVGNDYYPLLRTTNVEGEEGQYIHKIFERGHYISLSSDFIERIDIKITDDQGELLRFTYGKVIVKLHFRKKTIFM